MMPVYLRVLIPYQVLEQAELGAKEYQRDIRACCGLDDSILTAEPTAFEHQYRGSNS